ncbi:MAG: T9SS type A sorting domain-containing protein, partial [Saprospiraceae bacterium]|nr:T9SS type A sorting domain-containing protein [Saprospiraceae bacterium]
DGLQWTNHSERLPSKQVYHLTIDQYDNLWISTANGLAVYNEDGIRTLGGVEVYRLEGRVYFDADSDGQYTPGLDAPVAQQRVFILPDSIQLLTNETGKYGLNLLEGTYEVAMAPIPNWSPENGSGNLSVVLDTISITNADIRLVPDTLFEASELYLTGDIARCDRDANYYLGFRNTGTTTLNGRINLLPSQLTPLLASEPLLQFDSNTGEFYADVTGVLPFSLAQFKVQTHIPGVLSLDQPIDWKAWYYPNTQPLPDDSVSFSQPVRCAYDPNDKMGLSAGPVMDSLSLLRNELLFTIRFQNTGNDTAFMVELRDTFDADLDLTSFRVLQTSHSMATFIGENGEIRFLFENILLPDSTTNEPASHGFVQYSVRAKSGLPEPVQIENTAFIYFDSNPPIVTNTTMNQLVEEFPIDNVGEQPANLSLFWLQPNPASEVVNLIVEGLLDYPAMLILKDLTGRIVFEQALSQSCQPCLIELGQLTPGVYIATLISNDKSESKALIKH